MGIRWPFKHIIIQLATPHNVNQNGMLCFKGGVISENIMQF